MASGQDLASLKAVADQGFEGNSMLKGDVLSLKVDDLDMMKALIGLEDVRNRRRSR